jgi:hypothetical protein
MRFQRGSMVAVVAIKPRALILLLGAWRRDQALAKSRSGEMSRNSISRFYARARQVGAASSRSAANRSHNSHGFELAGSSASSAIRCIELRD